jgi:phospholipid transport system substrate-binding protein
MTSHAARSITRVAVAAFAAGLVCSFAPGSASAQTTAESFVQQNTSRALAILGDKTLNAADRRARMQDLMASFLDLKRMALFALGTAARTAAPADIDAFVAAYRQFALANYATELSSYMGQTLRMTNTAQRAPGDYIVNAMMIDPADKSDPPAPVSFRVLDEGAGKFALVDASVAGVWFTLAQRDDFRGYLGQHGGDISALIAHLKDQAAHPQAASNAAR